MERRRIEEWAALYELEPTLKDVFVEGPTDRAFVRTVLEHLELDAVQVYDIDAVDVPVELLRESGLDEGNRGRVIATAIHLERVSAVDLTHRVCCIADADSEAGAHPRIQGSLLLYTDYTSMQLYSYSSSTLQRYFDQVVLGMPLAAEQVMSICEPVLRTAAVSRRAAIVMELRASPVELIADCALAGASIVFDADRFLTRFLNKASALRLRTQYADEMRRLDASLPQSSLMWIHEEDLLDLLHWMIVRTRGANRTVARHMLGKALLLAVSLPDVAEQPLFVELRRRLSDNVDRAA